MLFDDLARLLENILQDLLVLKAENLRRCSGDLLVQHAHTITGSRSLCLIPVLSELSLIVQGALLLSLFLQSLQSGHLLAEDIKRSPLTVCQLGGIQLLGSHVQNLMVRKSVGSELIADIRLLLVESLRQRDHIAVVIVGDRIGRLDLLGRECNILECTGSVFLHDPIIAKPDLHRLKECSLALVAEGSHHIAQNFFDS